MDSSQDKNLPATARKLQKARDDGQAARSRDLSHLAVLGMGAVMVWAFAQTLSDYLQQALATQLHFDAKTLLSPRTMLERLEAMTLVGLGGSLGFLIATSAAAIASAIAAGGWVYSTKPLGPNFNRLNPLSGFANLFSKQQLINVAKMVLMTIILGYVAWRYFDQGMEKVIPLALQPGAAALGSMGQWLATGMALLLLVVFLVAVIDIPLQAVLFKTRLKMSHEEVKQEHKEAEGNPEIKGKIRQKQREIANRTSVAQVPKADFVVMNPTHYAVALRYDEETMDAPQVISKGTDLIALQIRDVAKTHEVPVLQSPMLARALYANAELEQPIPAQLYAAVAQVLAYVYRLKAAMRGEGRMPEAQPDPFVPPELDPQHSAYRRRNRLGEAL